jgi:hypothetical protein
MPQDPDKILLDLLAQAADAGPQGRADAQAIDSLLDSVAAPSFSARQHAAILTNARIHAAHSGGAIPGGLRRLVTWAVVAAAAASIMALAIVWNRQDAASPDPLVMQYRVELPPPPFSLTPLPGSAEDIPHLESHSSAPETFVAPRGLRNLALCKPVLSSDPAPLTGTLDWVTDGIKQDAENVCLELNSGPQWVEIDLGEECEIYALVVWRRIDQPAVYRDVVVQLISADRKSTRTIFNNDFDNSLGLGPGADPHYRESRLGRILTAPGATARFVRLWSNGRYVDDANHYVEVEAWGRAAASVPAP